MTGFSVPVTFGPWLDTYLDQGPWNVVVIMIGINDLLRGGRAADDIMGGLTPMIQKVSLITDCWLLQRSCCCGGLVGANPALELYPVTLW